MFIKVKRSGYDSHAEQFCSGLFLILTQPKESQKYPSHSDKCHDCGKSRAEHEIPLSPDVQAIYDKMHRIWKHLFSERTRDNPYLESVKDACEVVMNAQHEVTGCRYFRPTAISYPIRAIVRHVAMRQLGQFMMGYARVKGHRLTLSGAYGSDGLPDSVPDEVYEQGIELPQYLYDAWNNGGGWNGTASEAEQMQVWALKNLKELRA